MLEIGYEKIWKLFINGHPPIHVYVSPTETHENLHSISTYLYTSNNHVKEIELHVSIMNNDGNIAHDENNWDVDNEDDVSVMKEHFVKKFIQYFFSIIKMVIIVSLTNKWKKAEVMKDDDNANIKKSQPKKKKAIK